MHQVEGMRLAALQAAAADVAAPDLAGEVARLRDEVRASSEIDESLARARRDHRQTER